MKPRLIQSTGGERGFTLNEIMVTMAILLMVLAGMLSAHLFGMRMLEITKAKLGANDEARRAIGWLIEEVRTAKIVKIGKGDLGSFAEVETGTKQKGNALQIYPTADTNTFIRYFWDAADNRLKRTTDGAASVAIVASSITNQNVFTAEDHLGNLLENNQNNRVIGLTLQFYQIQYPIVPIGAGQFYDFYQLRTKITRRALE